MNDIDESHKRDIPEKKQSKGDWKNIKSCVTLVSAKPHVRFLYKINNLCMFFLN